MLILVDAVPSGCLQDCLAVRPEGVVILPVLQAVVMSERRPSHMTNPLTTMVQTMLAQFRQARLCCVDDKTRVVCFYWSQMPLNATAFEAKFIERHIKSLERMLGVPHRRIFVHIPKDYVFDRLAQQNVPVSTYEIESYTTRMQRMFTYDRVVSVEPHSFETLSTLKANVVALINHS